MKRFRWDDIHAFPSCAAAKQYSLGYYLDPFLITTTSLQVSFWNEFLLSQMGIPLQLLSVAHGVNRQRGGSQAREATEGSFSDLLFAPEHWVTLECQAHHFLTDGRLCDNTWLPQKTERRLNNMLVQDLANAWCHTGYSVAITFVNLTIPSEFKGKWLFRRA